MLRNRPLLRLPSLSQICYKQSEEEFVALVVVTCKQHSVFEDFLLFLEPSEDLN